MTKYFQGIFGKQPLLKSSTADIRDFLNSDNDTETLIELDKRKFPKEVADKMEGPLTLIEMENALFNHMNGTSSPGIDGFTVAFLRLFFGMK